MLRTLIRQQVALTVMAVSLTSLTACSNVGKSDAVETQAPPEPVTGPVLAADLVKPSRILVTPKAEWSDVRGYIVGRADSSALVPITDQPGKLGFQNLSSGHYDIVLEAKEKGADGIVSAVALKISGISLAESSDAQIRDIELKPYVKLDGRVVLNESDSSSEGHGGIAVTLSGTVLKTVTAADGSYSFSAVPVGNHAIEMSASGYQGGFLLERAYRAAERVPTIALMKESHRLDTGVHYLGARIAAQSAQKISLQLKAPSPTNYFRFAVGGEAIENRPWLVLQSSLEIDLPSGEKPEVHVQYSVDERQLSPVFTTIIPVE